MIFGKHFTKYYIKYGILFIIGIIALVVVDYAQLEIPNIVGDIIDEIKDGMLTKDNLLAYVRNIILVAVVVFTGRFLWRICIFGNAIKIEADIRNEMFLKMEKLSVSYYAQNKTGALMAFFTNDLQTIRQCFGSGTLMFVDALAMGILAFTKMIKLSWKLSIICLIPLLLVSCFAVLMRRRISLKVRKNLEAFSSLSDYVQEDFSGINVIKAYVKEKKREFLFRKYNDENMNTALASAKDQVFVQVVINAILTIITIVIIFYGGYGIWAKQNGYAEISFTVGELTKFNAYFGSLIWPIMAIGELINLKSQSKASEERITKLLDEEVEINDENTDPSLIIKGKIEYRNVYFKYPDGEINVLSNVSFIIQKGEMVGIMGGTGSGKSTIVELLLRLYNVENNTILIDDNDIMKYPLKNIREQIAYVPQETFLFKQSIDENIAFSCPTIIEEKTHQAAYLSGVSTDIEGFKNGYNTILGERGVTVSGGQKQRIAIARALIKDAPILILDDSLSAVDTLTESHILKELRKIRSDKTTIIIAHRITTLEALDKIIVVDDGTIDAVGTHEELLKSCKLYQREVKLQELEKELDE